MNLFFVINLNLKSGFIQLNTGILQFMQPKNS